MAKGLGFVFFFQGGSREVRTCKATITSSPEYAQLLVFPPAMFRLTADRHEMGSCQNYGPFLGTLNNRCFLIIGTRKGTLILTTTHMCKSTLISGRLRHLNVQHQT